MCDDCDKDIQDAWDSGYKNGIQDTKDSSFDEGYNVGKEETTRDLSEYYEEIISNTKNDTTREMELQYDRKICNLNCVIEALNEQIRDMISKNKDN